MRQLKWSQNTSGTLNGKVGHVTLFTVSYYPERGYFVAPKLPGLNKTIPVNSEEAGKKKAEALYREFFDFLMGADAIQNPTIRSQLVSGWILVKRLFIILNQSLLAMVGRWKSGG